MASEPRESYDNRKDWLTQEMSVGKQSQDEAAYEYLCRLEEAKKWMESVLNEELPSALELEEYLQNGVLLCKLAMKLLPDEPMWKKVYDLDQSKFKAAREKSRGLDYRYTDNINFWLTSLQKLGLPKVFYPVMTDIYHRKNMPKLIYCLHALSHLLKKKGKVTSAVDELYGTLKFAPDAVSQTSETLRAFHGKADMPAFGVVENLVEEELQYQAMGLFDSFEEDTPHSPSNKITTVNVEELFDDPKYVSSTTVQQVQPPAVDQVNGCNSENERNPFATTISCNNSMFSASLYHFKRKTLPRANGSPLKTRINTLSPVEVAVKNLNEVLEKGDPAQTLKALKNPDGNFPFIYQDGSKYHKALLKEKKGGLPGTILPVFSGIDRDICDCLLEKMTPGAYIVRSSKSVAGAYVFSFRNQTGIKHWKLSTKGGKFFWGHSPLYSSVDGFVQNFVDALSLVTKLHVYCGMTTALQPVLQTPEHQAVVDSLRESDSNLMYGQICKVITEVNSEIRHGRKSTSNEPHEHLPPQGKPWDKSMVAKVNRTEAYRMLNENGQPGSFIIRHSDSTPGDFALTFRTKDETRHWKIAASQGKYYVHPRPQPYESLDEIVDHFREAVGQETGIVMNPLACEKASPSHGAQLRVSPDGGGSGSNPSSLTRQSTLSTPSRDSVAPSLSLSKLNPANLTSWTVEDVCCWLLQQDLGRFVEVFQENAVDGECLLTLDNNLLKNDLGIDALGHRSRILRRVNALKEQMHPQLT